MLIVFLQGINFPLYYPEGTHFQELLAQACELSDDCTVVVMDSNEERVICEVTYGEVRFSATGSDIPF